MSFTPTGKKITQLAYISSVKALATVTFDVSESESHKSSAKVTDHPVEEGANIADHVVVGADTLSLTAWVSNTPIVNDVEAPFVDAQRAEAAHKELRRMKDAASTCRVVTTLRVYKSMVITSVNVTRDASTGHALAVSVDLQQIRTATSEEVEAPQPKDERGKKSVDEGKKTTVDAPPAVDEKSRTILLEQLQSRSTNVSRLTQ